MILVQRPRRNRKNSSIRELISETYLNSNQLIWPLFLVEGQRVEIEIRTMPGQYRWSLDLIFKQIEMALSLGVNTFALFPAVNDLLKNSTATEALNEKGLLPLAVHEIKKRFPESVIITDVALDPYSSDGHDGLVYNNKILNDETVKVLTQMAVVQAAAGADIVAPSDMMDGRVGEIRKVLDLNGFADVSIMSYTAKYASSFYGPFREALDSAPKKGDKKTYQMDFRNKTEALRELELDIEEGADFVMVKPALSYLDIISEFKKRSSVPVAAYNVSGEYAMIKAAAKCGMLDETKAMVEMLYSIKRAGADIILTYFAIEMAKWIKNQ